MLTLLFWLLAAAVVAQTAAVAASLRTGGYHVLLVVAPVATLALGIALYFEWAGWWRIVPGVLFALAAVALWRLQRTDVSPA